MSEEDIRDLVSECLESESGVADIPDEVWERMKTRKVIKRVMAGLQKELTTPSHADYPAAAQLLAEIAELAIRPAPVRRRRARKPYRRRDAESRLHIVGCFLADAWVAAKLETGLAALEKDRNLNAAIEAFIAVVLLPSPEYQGAIDTGHDWKGVWAKIKGTDCEYKTPESLRVAFAQYEHREEAWRVGRWAVWEFMRKDGVLEWLGRVAALLMYMRDIGLDRAEPSTEGLDAYVHAFDAAWRAARAKCAQPEGSEGKAAQDDSQAAQ